MLCFMLTAIICRDEKFLELVYFLDIAKESHLMRHNPCIFCPDARQVS